MSDIDVFEETELPIKAWLDRGKGKTSDVTIVFSQTPGAVSVLAPVQAKADGEKTKTQKGIIATVDLPKVKDDADNYTLTYKIQIGKGKKLREFQGANGFVVWPSKINIAGTKDSGCKLELPKARYRISYKAESTTPTPATSNDGELGLNNIDLKYPGEYVIDAVSPYYVKDWKKEKGRNQKATVGLTPWTAKIRTVSDGRVEGTPRKQYVTEKDASQIKLEIGPQDLQLAVKGQEIKIRVTFPATNSKRQTPRPGLKVGSVAVVCAPPTGLPGVDECKFETTAKIPDDAKPVVMTVELGKAGGDKCKIEVGVTNAIEDDKLFLQTWRKIGLELLMAGTTHRQKCDDILAPGAPALGVALLAELNRIYEGTYIEFFFPPAGCATIAPADFKKYLKGDGANFTWEDIQRPADMFIPKAKFVTLEINQARTAYEKQAYNNGDKVFLCSDYQQRKLRSTKLPSVVKTVNTMTWLFVDFISARSETNLTGPAPDFKQDMSLVKNYLITTLAAAAAEVQLPFSVFDYDPIEADGSLGIVSVAWKASKYRKKGTNDWKAIGVGDPGEANKGWSADVVFNDLTERNKWCEIVDAVTLKVKLPKDNPGDPGNLLKLTRDEPKKVGVGTDAVEYEIAITVQVDCYGVDFGTLGGAVNGAGQLRTGGGRVTVLGMGQTMAHEIAHNCGQTYCAEVVGEVGGWTGTAVDGVPFPALVPTTPYYVGKGHQGSHCAKALMDVLEGKDQNDINAVCAGSFSSPSEDHKTKFFSKIKQKDQCIMFGDGPEMATESMDFCDTCKMYLRAVDLSNITGSW